MAKLHFRINSPNVPCFCGASWELLCVKISNEDDIKAVAKLVSKEHYCKTCLNKIFNYHLEFPEYDRERIKTMFRKFHAILTGKGDE